MKSSKRVPSIIYIIIIIYNLFLIIGCGGGGGGGGKHAELSLSLDPITLSVGRVNSPYNQSVSMIAKGGKSPYTYSCSITGGSGILASPSPTGTTIGNGLCILSGTPSLPGTYMVNFSVTDSAQTTITVAPISLTVNPYLDPLDNWHLRNQGDLLKAVTYGNDTFVAVGIFSTILTSADGTTWTSRPSGVTGAFEGLTYGNGTFVAVGDCGNCGTILTSADGITWISRIYGYTNAPLLGVTYGNGTFVAVGGGVVGKTSVGTILTSADGITWLSRISGGINHLNGVTYGNDTFVAVGFVGTILTSADGITWLSRTTFSIPLWRVTYGNGTFVAVGDYGTILTSADGITWLSRTSGTTYSLFGVTYGNDTFVTVGDYGTILQSDPVK